MKWLSEMYEKWNKPFLIANSDNDPVTGNNPGIAEKEFLPHKK